MNKIILSIGICLLIFSALYLQKDYNSLDKKVEKMKDLANGYGGGVIVSYDTETGEITGMRPSNIQTEAGRMSVFVDEYEKLKNELPSDVIVLEREVSPYRAIKAANELY